MPDQHNLPEGVYAREMAHHDERGVLLSDLPAIRAAAVEEFKERLLEDEAIQAASDRIRESTRPLGCDSWSVAEHVLKDALAAMRGCERQSTSSPSPTLERGWSARS